MYVRLSDITQPLRKKLVREIIRRDRSVRKIMEEFAREFEDLRKSWHRIEGV